MAIKKALRNAGALFASSVFLCNANAQTKEGITNSPKEEDTKRYVIEVNDASMGHFVSERMNLYLNENPSIFLGYAKSPDEAGKDLFNNVIKSAAKDWAKTFPIYVELKEKLNDWIGEHANLRLD